MPRTMVKHDGNRDNKAKIAKPLKAAPILVCPDELFIFFSTPVMFKEKTPL
jgi:hypothetical protein